MAQEDSKKAVSPNSDSTQPPPQLEAESLNSEMAKVGPTWTPPRILTLSAFIIIDHVNILLLH